MNMILAEDKRNTRTFSNMSPDIYEQLNLVWGMIYDVLPMTYTILGKVVKKIYGYAPNAEHRKVTREILPLVSENILYIDKSAQKIIYRIAHDKTEYTGFTLKQLALWLFMERYYTPASIQTFRYAASEPTLCTYSLRLKKSDRVYVQGCEILGTESGSESLVVSRIGANGVNTRSIVVTPNKEQFIMYKSLLPKGTYLALLDVSPEAIHKNNGEPALTFVKVD